MDKGSKQALIKSFRDDWLKNNPTNYYSFTAYRNVLDEYAPEEVEAAKLLWEAKSHPDARNKDEETCLHLAIYVNNPAKIIKELLADPRVDPNSRDKNDRTPLHRAILSDRQESLEALLSDPRVEPDAECKKEGAAMHMAAFHNRVDCMKSLLKSERVNPNAQDENGMTALHYAAEYEYVDIIKLLLADPRVDPTIRDKQNRTALDLGSKLFYRSDDYFPSPDLNVSVVEPLKKASEGWNRSYGKEIAV